MKISLILVLLGTISSCSTAPNNPSNLDTKELTGKWQLTETLADPGDGSGTWQTVENGRTLEFDKNDNVYSSTSYCNEEEINEASLDTTEKIISTDCGERVLELRYELKGRNLFVYPHNPMCIEACGSKYEKISD